jgi:microcystin-dependent protein
MRRLGDLSGEEVHLLNINEMPAHKHGSADVTGNTNGNGITDLSGAHTHTATDSGHTHSLPLSSAALTGVGPSDDVTQGSGYNTGTGFANITVAPAGAHHHKIGSTGGSAVHNNMQPTIFIGNMFVFGGKVRPSATNYYPYATGTVIF